MKPITTCPAAQPARAARRALAVAALLGAGLAGVLGGCASFRPAAQAEASDPRVRVEFVHPERFSDVGREVVRGDPGAEADLVALRRHLVRGAAPMLAPGERLEVRITEVDLAGQLEPWRLAGGGLRVVRSIYPPRIDLEFRWLAADGALIRAGRRQLRDPAFEAYPGGAGGERLRHEKAMLQRWLQDELGGAAR